MMQPVFRNPDKLQVLPHREWIRKNLPCGALGYVVEDLDLVVRAYGNKYATDKTGYFMFVELKFGNGCLGTAQRMTFRLIHDTCRGGDPDGKRYQGYYLVQYDNEDWDIANFKINHIGITRDSFIRFMNFEKLPGIQSYF